MVNLWASQWDFFLNLMVFHKWGVDRKRNQPQIIWVPSSPMGQIWQAHMVCQNTQEKRQECHSEKCKGCSRTVNRLASFVLSSIILESGGLEASVKAVFAADYKSGLFLHDCILLQSISMSQEKIAKITVIQKSRCWWRQSGKRSGKMRDQKRNKKCIHNQRSTNHSEYVCSEPVSILERNFEYKSLK